MSPEAGTAGRGGGHPAGAVSRRDAGKKYHGRSILPPSHWLSPARAGQSRSLVVQVWRSGPPGGEGWTVGLGKQRGNIRTGGQGRGSDILSLGLYVAVSFTDSQAACFPPPPSPYTPAHLSRVTHPPTVVRGPGCPRPHPHPLPRLAFLMVSSGSSASPRGLEKHPVPSCGVTGLCWGRGDLLRSCSQEPLEPTPWAGPRRSSAACLPAGPLFAHL